MDIVVYEVVNWLRTFRMPIGSCFLISWSNNRVWNWRSGTPDRRIVFASPTSFLTFSWNFLHQMNTWNNSGLFEVQTFMNKWCFNETIYVLKGCVVHNSCKNSQCIRLEIFISRAHIFSQTLSDDEHIVGVNFHFFNEHVNMSS